MTPELRVAIDADDLLASLIPRIASETDLVRRVGKVPLIDEAVRNRPSPGSRRVAVATQSSGSCRSAVLVSIALDAAVEVSLRFRHTTCTPFSSS